MNSNLKKMWIVTTTDGRQYMYDSFEAAFLAARTLFGWEGYTITSTVDDFIAVSKVRDKERKT